MANWGDYQPNYQYEGGPDGSEPGGFVGPGGGGLYPGAEPGGYAGDTNPEGAGADPFAYTQGSWLTPWQGKFSYSGGTGGAVAQYSPFNYADINYNAPDPGRFTENYNDPAAFRFADFNGPSQFQAPTEAEMKTDPGYQARMNAAMNASKAAGANSGVLRTGGFVKGLQDRAQDVASQEYGSLYGRRASEWDRENARAKDMYGINQRNTKEAFDTNVRNKLDAYGTRQNTWKGNADVALQQGQLGWNIASGSWDRNEGKARQAYEDEASHRAQVAAASNASAGQSYDRAMSEYLMGRDEFWTNQDRQVALEDRYAQTGLNAADRFGNYLFGGAGQQADLAVGAGDSRAAAKTASGNAWGNAFNDIGNYGAAAAYDYYGSRVPTTSPRPAGGGGAGSAGLGGFQLPHPGSVYGGGRTTQPNQ